MITLIVVLTYIWMDTDAFVEWAALLRLRFMKYREYNEMKKRALGPPIRGYTDFLLLNYNNFFIRLITCPICLTTWLNILTVCVFYKGIAYLGLRIITTWLLYFGLRRLIEKWNA